VITGRTVELHRSSDLMGVAAVGTRLLFRDRNRKGVGKTLAACALLPPAALAAVLRVNGNEAGRRRC